jgi:hypothetical protein
VTLLARSAGSLFAGLGLLAALTALAGLAALTALAGLGLLTALVTLWCAHRFVSEVGTLVLRNRDATSKGGS